MQIHLCTACQKMAVAYALNESIQKPDEEVLGVLIPQLDKFFEETGHYTFGIWEEDATPCAACQDPEATFVWCYWGELEPLTRDDVLLLLNDETEAYEGQCSVATEKSRVYGANVGIVGCMPDWGSWHDTAQDAVESLKQIAEDNEEALPEDFIAWVLSDQEGATHPVAMPDEQDPEVLDRIKRSITVYRMWPDTLSSFLKPR